METNEETLRVAAEEGQSVTGAVDAKSGLKTITRARLEEIRAKPRETKLVQLPKPYDDLAFRIRKGKVHEREKWEKDNTIIKNGKARMSQDYVRANLLILACVNDDGSRMFEGNKADREFINDLPSDVVEYVFDEICEYWGITTRDKEEILANAGN